MKFLNVYCENRKAEVFIGVDKIVLLTKQGDDTSLIELEGNNESVKVLMATEELVRKINGEDRAGIGFRRSL